MLKNQNVQNEKKQAQNNTMMFTKQDTESKQKFLLAKRKNLLKNPDKLFLTLHNLKAIRSPFQPIIKELLRIKQIKAQSVDFAHNNHPQVPKILYNVSFINLRFLYLYDTGIQSIEFLTPINTQKLKILTLDQNHIVHLKPLIKILSKNLTVLTLRKNPTLQTNYLSRVPLSQQFQASYLINKMFTSSYLQFSKIKSNVIQSVCSSIRQVQNSQNLIQNHALKIIKRIKSYI